VTIVMGTLSVRFSEPLVMRFGARNTVLPGMALIAAALCLFARSPVDGSFVRDVLPSMLLLGAGAGVAFPALMNLAMSGAKPEEAGLASGLVNTSAQVGGALGLAVLATLSSSRSDALRDGGASAASALTGGYHLAYLIGAALVLAAIAVGLTVVRSDRPAVERVDAGPAVAEAAS
jgi:sugar phosphate permease